MNVIDAPCGPGRMVSMPSGDLLAVREEFETVRGNIEACRRLGVEASRHDSDLQGAIDVTGFAATEGLEKIETMLRELHKGAVDAGR
jgi:hypothetical protein